MHQQINLEEMYNHIDHNLNTLTVQEDGHDTLYLLSEYSSIGQLAQLEKLSKLVGSNEQSVGFKKTIGSKGETFLEPTKLGSEFFKPLIRFASTVLNESYLYSPRIIAVREAINLGSTEYVHFNPTARPETRLSLSSNKTYGEFFNDVVLNLANIQGGSSFRESLRLRVRNSQRNFKRGIALESQIFQNRSRVLVLSLTVTYKPEFRHEITLETIQGHREKFFSNLRTNRLLRGIKDYMWSIEEGAQSGLHMHWLLFYSNSSCHDVLIGKAIGEYWVKVITKGRGSYWNSNRSKAIHQRHGHGIGTGEINWNDLAKRNALRQNIQYLTKAEQFVMSKNSKKARLFGMSVPEAKKRQGRPRILLNSD